MKRTTKKQLREDVEFLHEYARREAGYLSGAPSDPDDEDSEDCGDVHTRDCREAMERLLTFIATHKLKG